MNDILPSLVINLSRYNLLGKEEFQRTCLKEFIWQVIGHLIRLYGIYSSVRKLKLRVVGYSGPIGYARIESVQPEEDEEIVPFKKTFLLSPDMSVDIRLRNA